jgi:hypothetical protein
MQSQPFRHDMLHVNALVDVAAQPQDRNSRQQGGDRRANAPAANHDVHPGHDVRTRQRKLKMGPAVTPEKGSIRRSDQGPRPQTVQGAQDFFHQGVRPRGGQIDVHQGPLPGGHGGRAARDGGPPDHGPHVPMVRGGAAGRHDFGNIGVEDPIPAGEQTGYFLLFGLVAELGADANEPPRRPMGDEGLQQTQDDLAGQRPQTVLHPSVQPRPKIPGVGAPMRSDDVDVGQPRDGRARDQRRPNPADHDVGRGLPEHFQVPGDVIFDVRVPEIEVELGKAAEKLARRNGGEREKGEFQRAQLGVVAGVPSQHRGKPGGIEGTGQRQHPTGVDGTDRFGHEEDARGGHPLFLPPGTRPRKGIIRQSVRRAL